MDRSITADHVATERVEAVDADHETWPAERVRALERNVDGEIEHDAVHVRSLVRQLRKAGVRSLQRQPRKECSSNSASYDAYTHL